MTLRFNLFGFELARVELDIVQPEVVQPASLIDTLAKNTTRWWMRKIV